MSSSPTPLPPNQSLPAELRAGDAVSLLIQTGQPAGYTVNYALVAWQNGAGNRYTFGDPDGMTVAADGTVQLTISGPDTSIFVPGAYDWVGYAFDPSGNRITFATGRVVVLPDVAEGVPVDPRSPNKKMLDAITAMLAGKALDDVAIYKINNRELTKYTIKELEEWRGLYATRVRAERVRAGQKVPPKTIGISFGGWG